MPMLYGEHFLDPETDNFHAKEGWRLLPLRTVGSWVAKAPNSTPGHEQSTMTGFLQDFVEWSKSLENTKAKSLGQAASM